MKSMKSRNNLMNVLLNSTSSTMIVAGALAVMSAAAVAHSPGKMDAGSKDKMHAAHHHAAVIKEQKDWGIAGDAANVSRTIKMVMTDDMKFSPNQISVKKDETIRFQIVNSGKVMHEMVIGTKKELDEHAAMMLKHPNMEHDEPYMAHVEPGKSQDLIWQFNRAGEFDFACLIPGHYQAGMVGKIKVGP
jgi:uncharacterized cupredoxin-like copper-binding protein